MTKETNPQEILNEILLKMNYDLSKTLSEQGKPDNLMFGQSDNPAYTGKVAAKQTPTDLKRGAETASKQVAELRKSLGLDNPHTWLQIGSMAAFLVPGIGAAVALGLSLGFDAADSITYWNEGNKEMAGLSALLSVMPLVGDIPGVKKVTQKMLTSVKDKLKKVAQGVKNIQFSPNEMVFVNSIMRNKEQIAKSADNKIKISLKKKKQAPAVLNAIKSGVKIGAQLGAYSAASGVYSDVYGKVQSETPKSVAQNMGYDWVEIKDAFMSSGSAEDNIKLRDALLSGWIPGETIPDKFQTDLFKKAVQEYLSSN
jgi:hypothetical protein